MPFVISFKCCSFSKAVIFCISGLPLYDSANAEASIAPAAFTVVDVPIFPLPVFVVDVPTVPFPVYSVISTLGIFVVVVDVSVLLEVYVVVPPPVAPPNTNPETNP